MKKIIAVSFLLFSFPAWADLQTDMINDRLDRLDREMTLMQKRVYSQPSPTTPALTTEGGAPNLSELYLQLEEQNQTISDLTRKVEELTHAQDVLKEQLFKMQADTDLRFQEANKPSQSNPQPPPSPKTDKEAYDAAYNLLIKAKYPEAERAFTAFLRDYPNSSLAGNANYWLGETYYVRGEYQVAAGIFSDGLTKYEKSTKAPDNLLKLGLTMANLKEKDEACGFFKLMPEQFPKANETLKQRAKQEAKKLACP